MIELTVRIIFSLLVVFGLLWGLAKLARRPLSGRRGAFLEVVARQQLTRGSAVAVVKVADRALILGVTEQGITLLADADPALFEEEPAPVPPAATQRLAGSALSPATWRQTFAFFRNRGGSP
jgi:flagellar protein FliO/FliZ